MDRRPFQMDWLCFQHVVGSSPAHPLSLPRNDFSLDLAACLTNTHASVHILADANAHNICWKSSDSEKVPSVQTSAGVYVRVLERRNTESFSFVKVVFDKLKWINTWPHTHTHTQFHSIRLPGTHLWGKVFPIRPTSDTDHLWHRWPPSTFPTPAKIT